MTDRSKPQILVIGGGVAGLSASIRLTEAGVPHRWCASGLFGGALNRVFNPILDWPGFEDGSGRDAIRLLESWTKRRPEHGHIESLELNASGWVAQLDGNPVQAQGVILCTGTKPNLEAVAGADELVDRGVYLSTSRHAPRLTGKHALVIGGSDGATEGALILDRNGVQVDLSARSPLRGKPEFLEGIKRSDVRLLPIPTTVARLRQADDGDVIAEFSDGHVATYNAVFMKTGVKPVYPTFLGQAPRCDDRGYLFVDGEQQTNLEGLWAAGDVCSCPRKTIAAASKSGFRAADAAAMFCERAQ